MDSAAGNRQLKMHVIYWLLNVKGNGQSGDLGEEGSNFIFKNGVEMRFK